MTDNPRDEVTLTKASVGVSGSASDEARELQRAGLVTHCREQMADGSKCGESAEFILWGKLFLGSQLGPRCYDHAAAAVGHRALGDSQWAIADLRPVRALSERLVGLSADVSRLTAERDIAIRVAHDSQARVAVLREAAEWVRDCRGVEALEDQFEEALNALEASLRDAGEEKP